MSEASFYHGHSIDLHLRELKPGRFQSTYFIDANYCFQVTTETFAIAAARAEAIARAHGSIDALDSLKTPPRGGHKPSTAR